MPYKGIRGKTCEHRGKQHFLLLATDGDGCYHIIHTVDGKVGRKINLGYNPITATMEFEQEASILEEWIRNDT